MTVRRIPELTGFFAKKVAEEYGNAPKNFTEDALEELKKIDWTGNIRELRNVVERLIILGGDEITATDVKNYASK